MVTLRDAQIMAARIQDASPKVHGIELFGSVFKNGRGYDIDLMLIVDDKLSNQFWSVTKDITPRLPYQLLFLRKLIKKIFHPLDELLVTKVKQSRRARASNLIELDLTALAENYGQGLIIDVWLMPRHWRKNITGITNHPNTINFLEKAARNSVKLV